MLCIDKFFTLRDVSDSPISSGEYNNPDLPIQSYTVFPFYLAVHAAELPKPMRMFWMQNKMQKEYHLHVPAHRSPNLTY